MGDVKIGDLRHQVVIRKHSSTQDAAGQPIASWLSVGPLFAAFEYKEAGSEERHLANQTTNVTAVNFTIRNSPERTISTRDEILFEGKIHGITSVLHADAKRCFLLLETRQIGEYNVDEFQNGFFVTPDGQRWETPDGAPWVFLN